MRYTMKLKTRLMGTFLVGSTLAVLMIFLSRTEKAPHERWDESQFLVKGNQSRGARAIARSLMSEMRSPVFRAQFTDDHQVNEEVDKLLRRLVGDLRPRQTDKWSPWTKAVHWVRARSLVPEKAPGLGTICKSLSDNEITKADVKKKGTQLKLLLRLKGGQEVFYKPMRYPRDWVNKGNSPYGGWDRHTSEIVAFHLGRLLNFLSVPIVVGRKVNVSKLKLVATQRLLNTYERLENGTECFYGECTLCEKSKSVCTDPEGILEGSIALLIPAKYELTSSLHPWRLSYSGSSEEKVKIENQHVPQHCDAGLKKKLGTQRLLDLVDASIFDYLMANADRHHVEVFKHVPNSALILLDNGKGFGHPDKDEMSILSPLYQCCVIRRSTYDRLMMFRSHSRTLSYSMDVLNQLDRLYPLLTKAHYDSMDRRLKAIIAAIQVCAREGDGVFY